MATGHGLELPATQSGAQSGTHAPPSVGRGVDGRLTMSARLGLLVICLAVFLSALDQYVVFTALPRMFDDLQISATRLDQAAWIVNGYLLGYIVAMPLMGRVADIYGRRAIFALCLVLFALGSLFCGLAPVLGSPIVPDATTLGGAILTPIYVFTQMALSMAGHAGVDTSLPALTVLVAARFVQAIGGGALVPVGMAVVGDLFGSTRRGLVLGLVGAVAEAGGVLGPLWGAAITNRLGWQWIFYLNVPVALALLLSGLALIPRVQRARGRIDLLGAILFGGFLVCLALGFGLQNSDLNILRAGSMIQPNITLLVVAAGLLALFIILELVVRSPLIDVRLFRNPGFSASMVLSWLIGIALVASLALITLFTRYVQLQQDPLVSGVTLLRMMVLIPVGAVVGGILSSRLGCPPAALAGTIAAAAGLYLMSRWPVDVGFAQMAVATTLAGLGFGMVIAPINTSALNTSGAQQTGMAAAMVTVLRMAGMLLGLSWLLLWAVSRFYALLAERHLSTNAIQLTALISLLHEVFRELFLIAAAIALAGAVPALLLWRKPRAQNSQAQDAANGYASYVAPLT
jgi:MFS family permease